MNKYPNAVDLVKFFKEAICKKPVKRYSMKSTGLNPEQFEDVLEIARSDIRKGYDRFEVLNELLFENQYYFDNEMDELKKLTKKGSEYRIVEHLDKKFIAELCKDKIEEEEEPEKFIKLFEKYCQKNYKSEITDADVDYARNIQMSELLEGMTDIKIKNKMSNCPFCDGSSNQKFSCRDNLFQCFKCGEKGDSIGFYMKLTGSNFIETIKELKKW